MKKTLILTFVIIYVFVIYSLNSFAVASAPLPLLDKVSGSGSSTWSYSSSHGSGSGSDSASGLFEKGSDGYWYGTSTYISDSDSTYDGTRYLSHSEQTLTCESGTCTDCYHYTSNYNGGTNGGNCYTYSTADYYYEYRPFINYMYGPGPMCEPTQANWNYNIVKSCNDMVSTITSSWSCNDFIDGITSISSGNYNEVDGVCINVCATRTTLATIVSTGEDICCVGMDSANPCHYSDCVYKNTGAVLDAYLPDGYTLSACPISLGGGSDCQCSLT